MRRTIALGLAACVAGFGVWSCDSDSFSGDSGSPDSQPDVPGIGGGDAASGDASKDGSVAIARFCETQDAQFCADFDIPGDAMAPFETVTQSNGYTFQFQNAQTKSVPTAFEIDVANATPQGGAYAQRPALASGPDAGPTSEMTLDVDIYVGANPSSTTQPLFAIQFGVLPAQQFTFALAHESQWELAHATGTPVVTLKPQPAIGEWGHLTLTMNLDPNLANVMIDWTTSAGHSVAQFQIATIPTANVPYPGNLVLGLEGVAAPVNALSIFYDNAVVRWQ